MNPLANKFKKNLQKKGRYQLNEPSDINKFNHLISPLLFPEELKSLYNEFNGSDYEDLIFIVSNFLSIEDAIYHYEWLSEASKDLDINWSKALFPIGEYNSIYLFITLKSDKLNSQIYTCDIGSGDLICELQFNHLNDLIETALTSNNLMEFELKQRQKCIDCYDCLLKDNSIIEGEN